MHNNIIWKASCVCTTMGYMLHPDTNENRIWCYKTCIFPKQWNSFHLTWNRLDYITLTWRFLLLNCERELYLKHHWHHSREKTLLFSAPQSIDLPLELVGGQPSQFMEIEINPCHLNSENAIENEAQLFALEWSLCNSIIIKVSSASSQGITTNLKAFF